MKMPFGKHKGKELQDVLEENPAYIIWLSENCELKGELRQFCKDNYNQAEEWVMEEKIAAKRRYLSRHGGRIDFLGNYEDEDGYDDPNFGWVAYDDYDGDY